MVQYNPKDWFTFIFKIHKADTVRQLFPMLIGMTLYSLAIVIVEIRMQWIDSSHLKNLLQMHTLLGLAISMLLVFRTNTAYDRWWEGRKLWGTLVNGSRNLAIKLKAVLPANDMDAKQNFENLISNFATTLHYHLRKETLREELAEYLQNKINIKNETSAHVPMKIAQRIVSEINDLYKQQKISGDQLIVLNAELAVFMDVCGACERIKNTPIPFSYSVFLKKIIFFYTMTLPVGFAFTLGYITIPVTVFIFYVLASLEIIAEEIEDPFSGDSNDLPTKQIAETITKNCAEILR